MASKDRVDCAEIISTPWENSEFSRRYGELRGGAPPQQVAAIISPFATLLRFAREYRYVAAVYGFSGAPPFAPNAGPRNRLRLPNPFGGKRIYPKLNPAVGEVIYPCGAVFDGGEWSSVTE